MNRLSDRHRERIRRGVARWHERRRELARVRPRDLERWERTGLVSPVLLPLVRIAEQESAEVIEALGGADVISAQQRVVVEDLVLVGVMLRGEAQRYLQTHDADAAARVGTLANTRRASIALLGLERRAKQIPSLAQLLREGAALDVTPPAAEDAPGAATQNRDGSVIEGEAERAPRAIVGDDVAEGTR